MAPHQPPTTDAADIRAILQGDAQRFERLIDRHFGSVFAVAMARLRDPEMAEDLAQEVFLRAFLHLKRLEQPQLFGAWVSRVARNLAIEWLRRGQRRSQLLPMVPLDSAPADVADSDAKGAREIMASKEEDSALRGAVMDLPTDEREIVLLHFGEDLSQREIAERLGLSQATVSRRLQGALEALRGALEPTLRREVAVFRAPRPAFARAGFLVLAAAALSGSAKAALASAGPMASLAAISGGKAVTAGTGAGGVLGILSTTITAGGKIMATWKGIMAAGAAVVAIGGGIYVANSGGEGPSGEAAPDPPAAVQQVDAQIADAVVDEPIAAQVPVPAPPAPQTSASDAAEFLNLIPDDAMIVMYTPMYQSAVERVIAFIEKAVGVSADNLREEWTAQLPPWEENGVDVNGSYAMAICQGDTGGRPEPLFMFSLSDAGAYESDIRANGAQVQSVSGHDLWTGARGFPERQIIPNSVSSVEGETVVTTFGQESATRLIDVLQPHATSSLAQQLIDTPDGSIRVTYDLARIVEEFGLQVRGLLDQIDAQMANPSPNVGMSFIGMTVWHLRNEMRSLLDLGQRAESFVVTVTPADEALRADLSLRLSGATTQHSQGAHPLALGTRIPSDPILALLCSAPGERGTSILRTFDTALAKILVGGDPSGLAALLEHEMAIIESFTPGRAEAALALYPPTEGGTLPRRVFIDRRSGGSGESARTIVDSLSVVLGRPARHIEQMGMPDVEFLDSTLEWRGMTEVEGLEVSHFVHTGPGLAGEIDPNDQVAAMISPQLRFFGPVGEVHHWLVALDDMVILTMEPTPELLGQILRGENLGIREPFAPIEGDTSPLPQGDFALRLSMGQLLGWVDGLVARVNPSQAGDGSPLAQMAARLQAEEEGIWLGADTLPGGFDAHLTIPATDALALTGMFVARVVVVEE